MTRSDTAGPDAAGLTYRYERFTPALMMRDMRFHRDALAPGDTLAPVVLTGVDGETVEVGGSRDRPQLLVTGSMTCPMTDSSAPVLRRLYEEYGERVDFVLVATREAHPGEVFPQPRTIEEKVEHARALQALHSIPFPVGVDDLDGTLHRLLDGKPNTAYLIDRTGEVVFRSLWAADEPALREALDMVSADQRPSRSESVSMTGPTVRALGSVGEVMTRAGRKAWRDLWTSAPPMAIAGALGGIYRGLPPERRGKAVAATLGVGLVVVIALVIWALV